MTTRKKVRIAIAITEKRLQKQHGMINEHKRYLVSLFNSKMLFVGIISFSVLLGYKSIKVRRIPAILKRLGEVLLVYCVRRMAVL